MPVQYRRLRFEFEGDGGPLLAALWEAGTLGVELGDGGRLTAYFTEPGPTGDIEWRAHGGRLTESDRMEGRDWLETYRAKARPIEIGKRLVVDPREPEDREATTGDRYLLRLPARTAFGTGGHASTRLVLEWLEEQDLEGLCVLDLGAGSGILSFAARLFGASWVVGLDIDSVAALVAAQNRRLNDLYPALVAGGLDCLGPSGSFDLALVNVLPHRIATDLSSLRDLLRVGGTAVFSGIVVESEAAVRHDLEAAGFRIDGQRASGEWLALEASTAAA